MKAFRLIKWHHLLSLLLFCSFPAATNTLPTVVVTGKCSDCPSSDPSGRSLDHWASFYLVMDGGGGSGDSGGDEWYGDVTEKNVFTNKLERVVINGSSMTNPATLCVGNLCSEHSTLRDSLIHAGGLGYPVFLDRMWNWLFRAPPPIVAMACNPMLIVESQHKQTTSQDDFIHRNHAAGNIMFAHYTYFNTIGANKTKFVIVYSDGGSEEWEYLTSNPAVPRHVGNLKLGNGISQCGN